MRYGMIRGVHVPIYNRCKMQHEGRPEVIPGPRPPMDQILVPTVLSVALSGEGSQGSSVLIKAAVEP